MNKAILKPERERPVLAKHHWIYSGAIQTLPEYQPGEILEVLDSRHQYLGYGYFSKGGSIVGRMLCFDKIPVEQQVQKLLTSAYNFRLDELDLSQTNCFRVINGEGDGFPGLTVDKYHDVVVIQSSTAGVDMLLDQIVEILWKLLKPRLIFERSDISARNVESLEQRKRVLKGEGSTTVEVLENGLKFTVDVEHSHKTGMYLDQREMRLFIGNKAKGKTLLNCFAYTGGFSVFAAALGAQKVDSIDISAEVLEVAKQNFALNNLDTKNHKFIAADVFKYLREQESLDYDIVILDPPAFAKRKQDVDQAIKGYREINRQAISKMPSGSYLLTCSCSYHVHPEIFLHTVSQAALDSGKQVRIIQKHHLSTDHPLNLFHAENEYLKSLLLRID
jgi:23S rRNA (cytosine1962-C5)-methyltransferase